MGRILPEYLSIWATNKLRAKRVTVKAGVRVEQSRLSDDGTEVEVLLSDGSEVGIVISTVIFCPTIMTATVKFFNMSKILANVCLDILSNSIIQNLKFLQTATVYM